MRARFIYEKFEQDSDPIKDMGIGIVGLWDYTLEDAAQEIWEITKPSVYAQINDARRGGRTYTIIPSNITKRGCDKLAFEPNDFTFKQLTKAVKKRIDDAIKNKIINLDYNIRYNTIKENVNEKFEQESDPIKDMGIGFPKFLKSEADRLLHTKYNELKKEFNIDNYDIDNEDYKLFICVAAVSMLGSIANKETVPNAFFDAYRYWKHNFSDKEYPSSYFSKVKLVKILKDKYGIEWDAQKVYEKFEAESDPISDMGIGLIHVIKLGLKKLNQESGVQHIAMWRGDTENLHISYYSYYFMESLLKCLDEKYFDKITYKRIGGRGSKSEITYFKGHSYSMSTRKDYVLHIKSKYQDHFRKAFEGHTFINEKFTEDTDPVKNLGIGLVEKIRRGLTQIIKDPQMIAFLGLSLIKQFGYSNGKLIVYTTFGMAANAPYIKESFQKHEMADYVIFNSKDNNKDSNYWFMLKIKRKYQRAFEEAISRMSVNEKFEEDSDPIKDMGIGLNNKRLSIIGNKLFDNKWQEYDIVAEHLEEYLNTSDENIYLLAKTTKKYKNETNKLINYVNKLNKNAKLGEEIYSREELHHVVTSIWYIITQIKTDLGIVVEAHDARHFREEITYWVDKNTFIKYLDKFPNMMNVNEKFEQDTDPIEDLGIGVRTFDNLKPGDIIQCIKRAKKFTFDDGSMLPKDGLYVVMNKKILFTSDTEPKKEELYITMTPAGFRQSLSSGLYYDIINIRDTIIACQTMPDCSVERLKILNFSKCNNIAPISLWKKHFKVLQKGDLVPPKNI